jgi:putative aminopeptidase FrvX
MAIDKVALLRELSELPGAPGFEDAVRARIEKAVRPHADRVRTDRLGTLIASFDGNGPRVMLAAHMDEVAFIVTHLHGGGFLSFTTLGGWDPRILPGGQVKVLGDAGEAVATIGVKPPHITTAAEREKVIPIDELTADTGLTKREMAARGIRIGTPMVPSTTFSQLTKNLVSGKAFDDRAGCTVMAALADGLKGVNADFVFTVQEEVGARGAGPAAFGLDPDYGLVLESTASADFPSVPEPRRPSVMGKGPVITAADRGTIVPVRLVRHLIRTAERVKVPYQVKKPLVGGTDAGAIHTSRAGVPTAIVSLSVRYLHSWSLMLDLRDMEAELKLVRGFLKDVAAGRLKG